MHRTCQQDVVRAKAQIAVLKTELMEAVKQYTDQVKRDPQESLDSILKCQQAGSKYFNYAEEFVGNSNLLGAHKSALWAQGFAEDCAEILKSMPEYYKLLYAGFDRIGSVPTLPVRPGSTSYANMQRMVKKYLSSAEVNQLKVLFEASDLPLYGFSNEAKEFMNKTLQTALLFVLGIAFLIVLLAIVIIQPVTPILSFIFGVCFLIVLIAIAFIKPEPSSFQYNVFRTVLALAGAGVVAVIPGFIEVTFGDWLRAGGALAVFVVLYFWNPALSGTEKTSKRRS